MKLPKLEDLDVEGKRVLVRVDLDIKETQKSIISPSQKLSRVADKAQNDNFRLKAVIPTFRYLIEKKSKIIVIGHRGRPQSVQDASLSLRDLAPILSELLEKEVKFIGDISFGSIQSTIGPSNHAIIYLLENLRFDKREEGNNKKFAKELVSFADIYVNEAFAVSHRKHASVVEVPLQFKSKSKNSVAAGMRFREEIGNLSKVLDNPKKPIYMVISGIKEDKLSYLKHFKVFADKILIAGRLPEFLSDKDDMPVRMQNGKMAVAKLLPDKEDITVNSIERFEKEIKNAGTIVVSGPIGKFEDEGHRQGTERVFKAVADSKAFKVAGGGETQKAISLLGLNNKFDWISVGGGAMLEYLAHGTLPGIEALIN